MIRVNNIHLSLGYDNKSVRKAVAQQLRIEEKSIKSCRFFADRLTQEKRIISTFLQPLTLNLISTRIKSAKSAVTLKLRESMNIIR